MPCRANMTALFPCRYRHIRSGEINNPPWWKINSRLYNPSDILMIENHTYNFSTKTLHSNNIGLNQNNSVYICEHHTSEVSSSSSMPTACAYRSKPGNLIIDPCKGKPSILLDSNIALILCLQLPIFNMWHIIDLRANLYHHH